MIRRPGHNQPFSVLLDLADANYWDLIEEIAQACKEAGNSTLIRVGLILGAGGRRSSVALSEFGEGVGRRLLSEEHSTLPGQDRLSLQRLMSEVIPIEQLVGMTPQDATRSECVSFSAMADDVARHIIDICKREGALIAAWRWGLRDPHAGRLLWQNLPLKKIIADGLVLTDYEEFPENAHLNGDRLVWTPTRVPTESDGFFFETGGSIYVEPALSAVSVPPDLTPAVAVYPAQTPLQRAAAAVGTATVLRRSGHDMASAAAFYSLPVLSNHYPDLLATEAKVRDYCLNRAHPERKWRGFASYGWGWRDSDPIVVAANICGALLGDFKPEEAVATSAGDLQFSVGVVLPSVHRVRAPLTTAWIAQPGQSLRLTSAYISGDRSEYADMPRVVAADAQLEEVWGELMVMAERLAQRWDADSVRARPRVLIPRTGKTSNLTRRLVRQNMDHGTFSRSALGGRSLLMPVGPEMSWSAAAAVGSFIQIQLGLHGVRSLVNIWVD